MRADAAKKFQITSAGQIGAAFGQYPADEHPFWIFKMINNKRAQFFERQDKSETDRSKIRWYFGEAGKTAPAALSTLSLKEVSQMGPLVLDLDEEVSDHSLTSLTYVEQQ